MQGITKCFVKASGGITLDPKLVEIDATQPK